MRELIYAVEGKAANLRTFAMDDPGDGGACHKYEIDGPIRKGEPGGKHGARYEFVVLLNFQNGPINADGNGVNGIQNEDLLAIVIDRLKGFQSGPYKCEENDRALRSCEAAMLALTDRTRKRIARGVEGTHQV